MKMKLKVISFVIGLLAILPMSSAWAGGGSTTTYYAALKAAVSSTGGGKVYAGTSQTPGTYALSSTSGNQSSTKQNEGKTFYAFAQADTGYQFDGWAESNGGDVVSKANPYSVTVKCSSTTKDSPTTKTVWANFSKIQLKGFVVSFVKDPVGGTYTVNEKPPTDTEEMTEAFVANLSATPAEGYALKGFYTLEGDTKKFFSSVSPASMTFTAGATVGAEFMEVVPVATYEGLKSALANADAVSAIADIEIPFGETIEVRKGAMLVIATGKMITAKGALVNNGTIVGGSIAHSYITVVQGKDVRVPWEDGTDGLEGSAAGTFLTDGTSGKYLVTSLKTTGVETFTNNGTCNGVDTSKVFATIDNQASGEKFISKPSATKPKAVLCTVAREKAANWINGVVELGATVTQGDDKTKEVYTTFGYALEACGYSTKDTNKMIVLLQDVTDGYGSTTDGTHSGSGTKAAACPKGAVDCASKKLTITSAGDKINPGGAFLKIFNCKNANSSTAIFNKKALTLYASFYNCIGKITICGKTYVCGYCFYDSPGVSISYESSYKVDGTSAASTLNFYGGDYCTTAYSQNLYYDTKNEYAVVYSGRYKSSLNPGQNLVSKTKYEVVPVEGSSTDVKVVKKFDSADAQIAVDGEPSALTLQAALDAATDGKLTIIALKKDIDLASNLVVPKGKKVRIDVYERKLTGDFKIINNGELEIIDMSGGVDKGQVGVAIENNGELLLCDAIYDGSITLNGGKCYFVDGQFNGDIVVADTVADARSVAEVGGGSYAKTTYAHSGATGNLKELCVGRGYVTGSAPAYLIANIPNAEVKYSSSAAKFEARAFNAESTTLYEKRNLRDECTKEEWIAVRRLQASAEMFGGWSVDCAVIFDRLVPQAGFNITLSGYSALGALDSNAEVAANSSYSAFLQALRYAPGGPYAPLRYSEFLPGGNHETDLDMTIGCKAATKGTSCDMEMRVVNGVSTQSGPKDYSYKTWEVLGTCRFVFGAGTNVAMLQPTEGAATFYLTLATAVASDATTGKAIKLCNDCNENVTVGKVCTIDLSNFEFTGTITAAEGYAVSQKDGVYEVMELRKIEVVTDEESGSGEEAFSVVVTGEELEKLGVGETTTDEEVKEILNERDESGLKNWEVIVVEQEKAKPNPTVVLAPVVETVNEKGQKVLTTGAQVENVDTSDIDYASLPAGNYRKAYVAEDANGKAVTIADTDKEEPTVAVVKNESKDKTIILPVPGLKEKGVKLTVADVIDERTLTPDDVVTFYDTDGVKKEWTYLGDDKWSDAKTQTEAGLVGTAASGCPLPAGGAFWLTRVNPEKPVVIVAEVPETVEQTVTKDEWNLAANPSSDSTKETPLDNVVQNPGADDEVIIPTANGVQKKAKYDSQKGWTYKQTKVVNGRVTKVDVKAGVKGGQGFWYISSGAQGGETKIKWK